MKNTVTVNHNGDRVRLGVNKSGVLYVPGRGEDAVGVVNPNGSIEIDGSMLAAVLADRAMPPGTDMRIGDANSLTHAVCLMRDIVGNRCGSLYGVLDMAGETLALGASGKGWLGKEERQRFAQSVDRGYYIAIAFDTKKPLSGERHSHVAQATQETINAACKAKKAGMKFAVIRVLPMREWKFNRNGTITKSSWVCAFAVSTLRKDRDKRAMKHGVGSCTVSASRKGNTHPVRVVKYRRG